MSISHTNRRGDVYYLHQGKTKTGKPSYHFSMKADGELVEAVPEGYEVHEKPSGQVFLRKIAAREVTDEEVGLVEAAVRRQTGLGRFCVDVVKNNIVVYEGHMKVMRFVLHEKQQRLFGVQRWCFRGAIDDWTWDMAIGALPGLVAKYVKHLDKESFFELM